jgi:hypothetical protein
MRSSILLSMDAIRYGRAQPPSRLKQQGFAQPGEGSMYTVLDAHPLGVNGILAYGYHQIIRHELLIALG